MTELNALIDQLRVRLQQIVSGTLDLTPSQEDIEEARRPLLDEFTESSTNYEDSNITTERVGNMVAGNEPFEMEIAEQSTEHTLESPQLATESGTEEVYQIIPIPFPSEGSPSEESLNESDLSIQQSAPLQEESVVTNAPTSEVESTIVSPIMTGESDTSGEQPFLTQEVNSDANSVATEDVVSDTTATQNELKEQDDVEIDLEEGGERTILVELPAISSSRILPNTKSRMPMRKSTFRGPDKITNYS